METEEPSSPRYSYLIIVNLLLLLPFWGFAENQASRLDAQVDHIIAFAEEEVKERLSLLDQSLIEHRLDASVRKIISRHLRYPAQTARNLGRAIAYFPIFEAELAAAGLPAALKYLPVIESALLPDAMSRVGAEGLWQFMPETAPEYGLRIDDYVDERLDTYAATQAAIRYLQSAYDYLGDWSLAIAAYNAGKGRVRRAQRRSGGKNFWAVRRFLPRETRNYVPAFIAAIYLTEFYAAHGISPTFPSLDEQLLENIVVDVPLSFYRIAQVTALPISLIQKLNPAYQKGYLPAYEGGHNLILPQRVVPALLTYLEKYGAETDEPVLPWAPIFELNAVLNTAKDYQKSISYVSTGDSLASLAERLQVPPSQLAIWNEITPLDSLIEGQKVQYFKPIHYRHLPQRKIIEGVWLAPAVFVGQQLVSETNTYRALPADVTAKYYLQLPEKMKPSSILASYPSLDKEAFLRENKLVKDRRLPAGRLVYLPLK